MLGSEVTENLKQGTLMWRQRAAHIGLGLPADHYVRLKCTREGNVLPLQEFNLDFIPKVIKVNFSFFVTKKHNYASVWTHLKCLAWICCETACFLPWEINIWSHLCTLGCHVTTRHIMSWRRAGRSGVTLWLPTAVTVWVDGFARDCSPES